VKLQPHLVVLTLVASVAAASALAGCASQKSNDTIAGAPGGANSFTVDDEGGASSGGSMPQFTGDCSSGLQSITISPPATTTTVTYPVQASPVTFTAMGTFAGGQTMDVTSCVAWNTDVPGVGAITEGTLTPGGAGQYTVTASDGSVSATATLTVKLTGSVNASNVDSDALDGTPGGSTFGIAYPLDGALFPYHFGDLAFQVVPPSGQTIARVNFTGDAIDFNVYAPCAPIANAATSGGCSIALPADLEPSLAGVSAGTNLTETVRLASASGANLVESAPISARWSSASLSGTIYYWSTPPETQNGASEIIRMNLSDAGTPPEVYLTNEDTAAYAQPLSGGGYCIGCHAISRDGSKLGIIIGGSSINADGDGYGSLFALIDVASKTPAAQEITQPGGQSLLNDGFATLSTFSESGDDMVQELQGSLYLRTADANLTSTGPLFPSVTESMTQPAWSPKGDRITFTSWVPDLSIPHQYDSKDLNGNETPGAQIWMATVSGTTFGTPTLLVPRVTNATEYYPAISDDSALVVFNESSCSGPGSPGNDGYGESPCDSYDDPSARLRLVAADGGTPVELDRASGRTSGWPASGTWTNSWPRFAPSHSTFQGKTLYWVAFSSRRAYGATLAGSANGSTAPQIWFAGVAVGAGALSGDPSFAPVWLPLQNSATPEVLSDGGLAQTLGGTGTPTGNHIPQWVVQYVPYVPQPTAQ
jgi:hypothetical protein